MYDYYQVIVSFLLFIISSLTNVFANYRMASHAQLKCVQDVAMELLHSVLFMGNTTNLHFISGLVPLHADINILFLYGYRNNHKIFAFVPLTCIFMKRTVLRNFRDFYCILSSKSLCSMLYKLH